MGPLRLRLARSVALMLLFAAPAGVEAAKAPAAAPVPTKPQLDRAAENFRIMISALQSDKVPQPVKSVLFVCAYSNSFSKISEGTDKVIDQKKLDRNNPSMVVGAMAAVCGYRPGEMGAQPKK